MHAQKTREAKRGREGAQLFKTFLCLLDKTSRPLGSDVQRHEGPKEGSVNQFSTLTNVT